MDFVLDTAIIQQLLPHRYPMLLLDRVEKWSKGRLVAQKNLTMNEKIFQGHFPGKPILPGIFMIEMAAQAAGVLTLLDNVKPDSVEAFQSDLTERAGEFSGHIGYLAKIAEAKFISLAEPGDVLHIFVKSESNNTGSQLTNVQFQLTNQSGKKVCQGKLSIIQA